MYIGVPREVKNHEYRVGLTPAACKELILHGHQVVIESKAGVGAGFCDDDYRQAGAAIVADAAALFEQATLIIKVKEPQPKEYPLLQERHTLFTYLHLAADQALTRALLDTGATTIAYELVSDSDGRLPLLAPMSEVAGRLSIQAGARCLEKVMGGSGVLLGGVPGVAAGRVVILGGGVVGTHAATIALGLGARVSILDKSLARLRVLDQQFQGQVETLYATDDAVQMQIGQADLVIGAVLVPGAAAPKLVTRDMLTLISEGSVLVDVAIDQGGCFESSRATTHQQPTYIEQGVVHYCVANIPGAVPRTSTMALTNATLPYILQLADEGVVDSLVRHPGLRAGLSTMAGDLTCRPVAETFSIPYLDPDDLLDISQRE